MGTKPRSSWNDLQLSVLQFERKKMKVVYTEKSFQSQVLQSRTSIPEAAKKLSIPYMKMHYRVRKWKREKEKEELAINDILLGYSSVRKAANKLGIPYSTLSSRTRKRQLGKYSLKTDVNANSRKPTVRNKKVNTAVETSQKPTVLKNIKVKVEFSEVIIAKAVNEVVLGKSLQAAAADNKILTTILHKRVVKWKEEFEERLKIEMKSSKVKETIPLKPIETKSEA